MFKILYNKILWINYVERDINHIYENILRKDNVYELLVKKYFNNIIAFKKILIILEKLPLYTSTELSFLSYIYELNQQWEQAIQIMEKVIYIEQWQNIDSWMDYGHFLRKISLYEDISNTLLLNLENYMNQYNDSIKEKYKQISIIEFLYEKI